MADFVLTLGDFAFQDKEVPEKIEVGGNQKLVVHDLIGGIRVIDAMGRLDDDLEWTGWFLGPNAGQRRAYLEAYRTAGAPLILTWADYRFQVLVKRFKAEFQRQYQYLYSIALEVLADLTNLSTQTSSPSLDDAVGSDLDTANDLTTSVADPTLTGLMGNVSSAIDAVSTLAGASPSVLNSVIQPLAAAAERVAVLNGAADSSIASAPGFSGIIAGGSGPGMAAAFSSQISAVTQQTSLAQLAAVIGRMTANLNAAGSSDNVISTVGANLFAIAASEYGDANDWTTIAQANGLSDPFVTGPADLVIPPVAADTDGVLGT